MRAMLAAVAMLAVGCVKDARRVPGSLVGEAHGLLRVDSGQMVAKSVDASGAPTEQKGNLTTLRYSAGGYGKLTRFGTLGGIDIGAALGYLSGDGDKHVFIDVRGGTSIQPFYVAPGPALLRVVGDFGVGLDRDHRYTYAGGRLGLGVNSRLFMLDAGFHRRFFDADGHDTAHEDRLSGVLSFRPGKARSTTFHVGVEIVRGDQRVLDSMGTELAHDDLFPGRYEMISIMIGTGNGASPSDRTELIRP